MNLRQQIVDSNIGSTKTKLKETDDGEAFLIFSHSLFTDKSIYSFDENDNVDGGQDKQIDAITIEEKGGEGFVYISQVKNQGSFSSNDIIKIRNGLNWIFNKRRSEFKTLSNVKFKDRIKDFRDLQANLGPSNINVKVAYITNGMTAEISDECEQEKKTILEEYDNDTFDSFSFGLIGADEIVDLINSQEKKNKKIDAEIKIKYDTNSPSLIKYHSHGLKGIICTTPASEIASLVNNDPKGFIFDLNIRRYLGNLGSVNKDIKETCTNEDNSYLFWFLNNGITIVCDKLDPVTDPDNPHVKLENMQIVNGCQTSKSLALAAQEGLLQEDSNVMLRIVETNNLDLVDKVVLTTNNQNQINARNLRANDKVQVDLQEVFRLYDLFYERKPRQYTEEAIDGKKIMPNDLVAVAYLAIVLKRPSDARSRKYKVWGEYYNRIFSGSIVEPYIVSSFIHKYVTNYLKTSGLVNDTNEFKRYIAKNASFHVARIASFKWRKNDIWTDKEKLEKEIDDLKADENLIDNIIQKSFDLLCRIIGKTESYTTDLNSALKSSHLDNNIYETLYKKKKKGITNS
jgi:hypothetical protein